MSLPANPALEALVKIADSSSSRQMVTETVRTAYALGKLDAVIELQLRQVEASRKARESQELNS